MKTKWLAPIAALFEMVNVGAAKAEEVKSPSLLAIPAHELVMPLTQEEGRKKAQTRRAMGIWEDIGTSHAALDAGCATGAAPLIAKIFGSEELAQLSCDLIDRMDALDETDPLTHAQFGATTRLDVMLSVTKPIMKDAYGYGAEELHNWAFIARSLGLQLTHEEADQIKAHLSKENHFKLDLTRSGNILDVLTAPDTIDNLAITQAIREKLMETDYTKGLTANATGKLVDEARFIAYRRLGESLHQKEAEQPAPPAAAPEVPAPIESAPVQLAPAPTTQAAAPQVPATGWDAKTTTPREPEPTPLPPIINQEPHPTDLWNWQKGTQTERGH
jgi:hypothetical protein